MGSLLALVDLTRSTGAITGHESGDRPGEHQDAAEEHPIGGQHGSDLAMLLHDGAGSDQHGTGPERVCALSLIHLLRRREAFSLWNEQETSAVARGSHTCRQPTSLKKLYVVARPSSASARPTPQTLPRQAQLPLERPSDCYPARWYEPAQSAALNS